MPDLALELEACVEGRFLVRWLADVLKQCFLSSSSSIFERPCVQYFMARALMKSTMYFFELASLIRIESICFLLPSS